MYFKSLLKCHINVTVCSIMTFTKGGLSTELSVSFPFIRNVKGSQEASSGSEGVSDQLHNQIICRLDEGHFVFAALVSELALGRSELCPSGFRLRPLF